MGACQWSDTLSSLVIDQPSSFMLKRALHSLGDDLPKFTGSLADAELGRVEFFNFGMQGLLRAAHAVHARMHVKL